MVIAVGVKVLVGTAFWEAQFQLVRWIFRALPSKTEKERAFKRCAPSYIVSYVHAFFLTWAGWCIVARLERAPPAERAWLYAGGANDPDFVAFVETTTLVFFTYVLYDAFHLALEFPDLGSYDMAAHHGVFWSRRPWRTRTARTRSPSGGCARARRARPCSPRDGSCGR